MRLLVVLALLTALGACDVAGERDALADSRPPPGIAPRFLPPDGWAWGVAQPDAMPQVRYGVSAPPGRRAEAHLVIVPSAMEPAEAWFETIRTLNAQGFAVWVVERPGFGGSGRHVRPHDLAHSPSVEAEALALNAVLTRIVAPAAEAPLVLLASADAAPAALLASRGGAPVVDIIVSGRAPPPPSASAPPWALRLGLGRLPSADWRPWTREHRPVPEGDPWRTKAAAAWPLANPDLRIGGASIALRSRSAGTSAANLERTPLGLASDAATCPSCDQLAIRGAGPSPHLDPDETREAWLTALTARLAKARATTPP